MDWVQVPRSLLTMLVTARSSSRSSLSTRLRSLSPPASQSRPSASDEPACRGVPASKRFLNSSMKLSSMSLRMMRISRMASK